MFAKDLAGRAVDKVVVEGIWFELMRRGRGWTVSLVGSEFDGFALIMKEFGPNWLVLLEMLVWRAVDKVAGVEALAMEEFGPN